MGISVVKRVCLFATMLVVVLPGAAIAQDVVDDGIYVRVAVGASFVSDFDQDITYHPQIAFVVAPPNRQTVALGEGLTAAVALGFDYADGIRTELEYRYAKTDIDSLTVGGGFFPDSTSFPDIDVKAHLVMANFYFDFTNDGPFTPFIGGGVGGAFVTIGAGTDAALALQGRAGVSYDLGGGAAVSTEFIYLRSNELSYGPNDDEFMPAGPFGSRLDGDRYKSSSVMLSFRKKF